MSLMVEQGFRCDIRARGQSLALVRERCPSVGVSRQRSLEEPRLGAGPGPAALPMLPAER